MPNIGEVTVTFGAKIPTQDYGNLELHVTWKGEANTAETKDLLDTARRTIGEAVMPLLDAQIERAIAYGKFVHVDDPEKYLMSMSQMFFWMRTVCPELAIPALARITPRSGNGSPAPAQPAAELPPRKSKEELAAELERMGIPGDIPTQQPTEEVDKQPAPKGTSRLAKTKNQPGKSNRI